MVHKVANVLFSNFSVITWPIITILTYPKRTYYRLSRYIRVALGEPKSILTIVNNLFFNDYFLSEVTNSKKYSKSYLNSQKTSNKVRNIENKIKAPCEDNLPSFHMSFEQATE